MKLMKDWYKETSSGYETIRDAIGTLKSWVDKGNLEITYPRTWKDMSDCFGLPYTSTSDFAAIWNCQADAHYKGNPNMVFSGVALTVNRKFVAYFMVYDNEGNEVGDAYVYMH